VVPRQLQGDPWWLRMAAARTLVSEYVKFLPVATRLAVARVTGRRETQDLAGVPQARVAHRIAVGW
jgi:hypothetical protein